MASRTRDTSVDQAAADQMVNAIQALAIALRQHTFPHAFPGFSDRRRTVREELQEAQRSVEKAIKYTKG